jgi:DNA-binding transcriptional MerR regulator
VAASAADNARIGPADGDPCVAVVRAAVLLRCDVDSANCNHYSCGMDPLADLKLSLPELAAAARVLVARAPAGERAVEAPDERTIRYYQTLGLVDRPMRYEGRTALYGLRHLCQVVAIPLLRGQGYSLAQIQSSLAGARTEALEGAVRQACGPLEDVVPARGAESPAAPPRLPPVPAAPFAGFPAPGKPTAAEPRALRAVEVAPGISVTVDPALVADPDDAIARITALFSPRGAS